MEKSMRFLKTTEVAEILKVTPIAVAKWIREGKIKAVRLPGGQYRIPESELEKLIMCEKV